MAYLDNNGLSHLWSLLKNKFYQKSEVYSKAETDNLIPTSDISANTSARHTHSNKSVLDGIKSTDITNWNGKTSNVGTITGITMNGSSKGTSGVVNLGTVLTEHQDLSEYAKKSDISSMYRYKGSVATTNDLPSSAVVGDVYNVEASDMNYAWNGLAWDALGGAVSVTSITNDEITAIINS